MKNFLLLHGALFSSEQMRPFAEKLAKNEIEGLIHNFDFNGHGINKSLDGFTMEGLSFQVKDYCLNHQLKNVIVIGNSLGGYVALYIQMREPNFFGKIITYNTKLDWSDAFTQKEVGKLDGEQMQLKIPDFYKKLSDLHSLPLNDLIDSTKAFLIHLKDKRYLFQQNIQCKKGDIKYIQSEGDTMLNKTDLEEFQKSVPFGTIHHIEGKHPIESANLEQLLEIVLG